MPRVSVIIPAFNAEAYIGDALRSVDAQTYGDWEVVLGDDRSTDGTVAVAKEFGDRVNIVTASENAGPATARNRAIAHASGELLAFLDADDYLLPTFLEEQVAQFDRHRDAGIVTCDARVLTDDGFLPRTYMQIVDFPDRVTKAVLLRGNPIFKAISPRAAVEEAGGFDPEIFGVEDWDLWLKIVERGYGVVANRSALAVYRLAPESVSSNHASMARSSQLFYRRALERGNLTARERRIARRELRLQQAIERVASEDGRSVGRIARALPLLTLVALEHPNRWPSYARMLAHRRLRFSSFQV
jgi:teichuronic acid biosynthesis glycosyltransferase TuaG